MKPIQEWARQKVVGDYLKIDGVNYQYIKTNDDGTVKVVKAIPITGVPYHKNSGYSNRFLVNNTQNMGYYLNTTYYATLSQDTKKALVLAKWNDASLNMTPNYVDAYVGLLTRAEFQEALTYYGGTLTAISSYGHEWTMTGVSGSSLHLYIINSNTSAVAGAQDDAYHAYRSYAIRPALVLRADLMVTDGGNVVINSPPTITPASTPSGTYTTKPSFNYTVTDADNNAMTVTESIDGIVFNTRTAVASGTQLTFTPPDLTWLRTRINQTVNITIKTDDGNGGVTTVNYPITRTTPAIDLQLKTPFETDVVARRLLLQLEGNIPGDAVVSVQACNNAFDASPTWENATNLVLSGFPYPFNNTTKTAAKWGVSFKVRVERGGSTQPIYIDGLGGAFD